MALPPAMRIFVIKRLSDDNDARRLERALAKLFEGVLEAQVTFTTEKARVDIVPIITQADLKPRGFICWV